MCHAYLIVDLAAPEPLDEKRLAELLPLLKEHRSQLCLIIVGAKPSDSKLDDNAVALIKRIADMTKPYGVKIALCPHYGDWLEKTSDTVRLAKKVNRPDEVGLIFNLGIWMLVDTNRDLRSAVKETQPWLMGAILSGSGTVGNVFAAQKGYLRPLGDGPFEIRDLLTALRDVNYTGPVGLQCWSIGGDAKTHLQQSMRVWGNVEGILRK